MKVAELFKTFVTSLSALRGGKVYRINVNFSTRSLHIPRNVNNKNNNGGSRREITKKAFHFYSDKTEITINKKVNKLNLKLAFLILNARSVAVFKPSLTSPRLTKFWAKISLLAEVSHSFLPRRERPLLAGKAKMSSCKRNKCAKLHLQFNTGTCLYYPAVQAYFGRRHGAACLVRIVVATIF